MTGIGYKIIHEPFLFSCYLFLWHEHILGFGRTDIDNKPGRLRCLRRVCVGSNNNYGDIAFAKRFAQMGWIVNIRLAYV